MIRVFLVVILFMGFIFSCEKSSEDSWVEKSDSLLSDNFQVESAKEMLYTEDIDIIADSILRHKTFFVQRVLDNIEGHILEWNEHSECILEKNYVHELTKEQIWKFSNIHRGKDWNRNIITLDAHNVLYNYRTGLDEPIFINWYFTKIAQNWYIYRLELVMLWSD